MRLNPDDSPRMARLFDMIENKPRSAANSQQDPLELAAEKLDKAADKLHSVAENLGTKKPAAPKTAPPAPPEPADNSPLSRKMEIAKLLAGKAGFGNSFDILTSKSGDLKKDTGFGKLMSLARNAAGSKGHDDLFDALFKRQGAAPVTGSGPANAPANKETKKAVEDLDESLTTLGGETSTLTKAIQDLNNSMKTSAEERLAAEIRERQRNAAARPANDVRANLHHFAPKDPNKEDPTEGLFDTLGDLFGGGGGPDIDIGGGGSKRRRARTPGTTSKRKGIVNSMKQALNFLKNPKVLAVGAAAAGTAVASGSAMASAADDVVDAVDDVKKSTPAKVTPAPPTPKPSAATVTSEVKEVIKDVVPPSSSVNASPVGQITTTKGAIKSVSSTARTLGKGLGKALGPAAIVLTAVSAWADMEDLYGLRQTDELSEDEFEEEFAAILGRVLSGAGGAIIGAKLGALGGGLAGSLVLPGPGSLAGAAVGGIGGAIAGSMAGEAAGDEVGRSIYRNFLAKPQTPAEWHPIQAGRRSGGPVDLSAPAPEEATHIAPRDYEDQGWLSRNAPKFLGGNAVAPQAPPGKVSEQLGDLSARYESARKGSAAIGYDKTGGNSYGKYQIATNTGTMKKFLSSLEDSNPEMYAKLKAAGGADGAKEGTDEFKAAWRDLAQDPEFTKQEHKFIEDTHYKPLVDKVYGETGLNINERSKALQDVAWSTSVQHGGGTDVISKAMKKLGKNKSDAVDDDELIQAIYGERAGRFGSSTEKVQASVRNRFVDEEQRALAMLDQETKDKLNPQEGMVAAAQPNTNIKEEVMETKAADVAQAEKQQQQQMAIPPMIAAPAPAPAQQASAEGGSAFRDDNPLLHLALMNSSAFG